MKTACQWWSDHSHQIKCSVLLIPMGQPCMTAYALLHLIQNATTVILIMGIFARCHCGNVFFVIFNEYIAQFLHFENIWWMQFNNSNQMNMYNFHLISCSTVPCIQFPIQFWYSQVTALRYSSILECRDLSHEMRFINIIGLIINSRTRYIGVWWMKSKVLYWKFAVCNSKEPKNFVVNSHCFWLQIKLRQLFGRIKVILKWLTWVKKINTQFISDVLCCCANFSRNCLDEMLSHKKR